MYTSFWESLMIPDTTSLFNQLCDQHKKRTRHYQRIEKHLANVTKSFELEKRRCLDQQIHQCIVPVLTEFQANLDRKNYQGHIELNATSTVAEANYIDSVNFYVTNQSTATAYQPWSQDPWLRVYREADSLNLLCDFTVGQLRSKALSFCLENSLVENYLSSLHSEIALLSHCRSSASIKKGEHSDDRQNSNHQQYGETQGVTLKLILHDFIETILLCQRVGLAHYLS